MRRVSRESLSAGEEIVIGQKADPARRQQAGRSSVAIGLQARVIDAHLNSTVYPRRTTRSKRRSAISGIERTQIALREPETRSLHRLMCRRRAGLRRPPIGRYRAPAHHRTRVVIARLIAPMPAAEIKRPRKPPAWREGRHQRFVFPALIRVPRIVGRPRILALAEYAASNAARAPSVDRTVGDAR